MWFGILTKKSVSRFSADAWLEIPEIEVAGCPACKGYQRVRAFKLWQRNYWEHVIRDDDSYDRIAEYILQNPSKWNDDQLNQEQKI